MRFIRKYVRTKQNCYQAKMLKLVESTLVAVPPHRVELCASTSSTSVGSRPLGYLKAEVWSGSRLAVNVASLFHNPEYLTPSTRVCLPGLCLSLVGICQRPCRSPRRLWADHNHNTQRSLQGRTYFYINPLHADFPKLYHIWWWLVCCLSAGELSWRFHDSFTNSTTSSFSCFRTFLVKTIQSLWLAIIHFISFLPSLFYSHFSLRQILLTSPSDLLPLLCVFKCASYSLAVPERHSSMQCKHCCVSTSS